MALRIRLRYSVLGLMAFVAILASAMAMLRSQSDAARYLHLLRRLQSRSVDERREAAAEIGLVRMSGASEGASDAALGLSECLADPDRRVRLAAAEAICPFGDQGVPAIPGLARMLDEDDRAFCSSAIRALRAINTPEAFTVLSKAVSESDPGRCRQIIEGLGEIPKASAPLLPALLGRLTRDPDASLRRDILSAVVKIEPDSEQVAGAKLLALRDASPEVRRTAAALLRTPDPVPSLAAFQKALRDPDAGVREEAMRGLSQIGLGDPRAIVALCDALGNPATHDAARSALAQANWRPGLRGMPEPGAREAVVPDLLNAMRREDDVTSGVIAARVCQMVVDAEREDQPVSQVLRDSVARLAGEAENRGLVYRRHLLVGILNARPSELVTPLVLDLLRFQPDLVSEPAGSARRRTWDEALGGLIDGARKHDPMIRNQLLIHLLPSELARSLMPAFSEMIAVGDQVLRNECLILNANLLNEARS
jgi:HEAT repeat protein